VETLTNFEERLGAAGYLDSLLALMDEAQVDTWSHMNTEVDAKTGVNLVAFSSGWGDGYYPSYFGLDAQGVCYLIMDFNVLDPETSD
jgi:hypothetical protein